MALLGMVPWASACDHSLEVPPPCNPLLDPSCLAQNRALGACFHHRFSQPLDQFIATTCPSGLDYSKEGLTLTLKERFDNPSLTSSFYILHGKVEAEISASKGRGVISSFYLHSDDLDEIDIAEIFGGDPFEFQSNFFVKGNTTTYDRGGYHTMTISPIGNYHKYAVEWTPEKVEWYLNGARVRVLKRDDPQGMPSSPMRLTFSLWAGGDPSNKEGTILWAGGSTNYAELPFQMHVRHVSVCDYSLGKEYVYGNRMGEWITVETPNDEGNERESRREDLAHKGLAKGAGGDSSKERLKPPLERVSGEFSGEKPRKSIPATSLGASLAPVSSSSAISTPTRLSKPAKGKKWLFSRLFQKSRTAEEDKNVPEVNHQLEPLPRLPTGLTLEASSVRGPGKAVVAAMRHVISHVTSWRISSSGICT